MWEDTLKTKFADEEVEVVRTFEPATPDTMYLKFPDGSQLKLEVEANVPDDVHGMAKSLRSYTPMPQRNTLTLISYSVPVCEKCG